MFGSGGVTSVSMRELSLVVAFQIVCVSLLGLEVSLLFQLNNSRWLSLWVSRVPREASRMCSHVGSCALIIIELASDRL